MADQTDTMAWGNLLDRYQQSYQEAPEFDNWKPPASESPYQGLVIAVRSGVAQHKDAQGNTTGDTYPYWSPRIQLLSGVDENGNSLEGQECALGFFSCRDAHSEGQLKTLARKLTGSAVADLRAVDSALRSAVGTAIVTFKVTQGKKGGAFINVVSVERVPVAAPTTANP